LRLPPPYHCAGLSLGGMIAPALAAQLGSDASSLTLFSSSARESGFWRLSGASICRMAARSVRYLSLDHRVNMPELVRPELLVSEPDLPGELDRIQQAEGFSAANGTRQLFAAMGWKIRSVLPELPGRRLVVVGSADKLVPPSNSHRLAELLDCPIQVLEGAGHDLGLDAPEEVARVLTEVTEG